MTPQSIVASPGQRPPAEAQLSASAIDEGIIARFTAHQREVIQHMTLPAGRDLSAIMVTSAVAPVAFYSALDAFRILVAHERRHMAQAERVTHADGFPKQPQ